MILNDSLLCSRGRPYYKQNLGWTAWVHSLSLSDHQNPYLQEESEQYNDQFEDLVEYYPYDGVNADDSLDAYVYDASEMAFGEEWLPTDHILIQF